MKTGFTLAELLISLGILGIIATFTIPKVLASQAKEAKMAATKEVMAAISGAYIKHKLQNRVSSNTIAADLISHLNYVKKETGLIDATPGSSQWECGNWGDCIRLHNGGVLGFADYKFGGTTHGHYLLFIFDPDGGYSGVSSGSGKSIEIMLHYNGRLKTTAQRSAATDITYESWSNTPVAWGPDTVPNWFQW